MTPVPHDRLPKVNTNFPTPPCEHTHTLESPFSSPSINPPREGVGGVLSFTKPIPHYTYIPLSIINLSYRLHLPPRGHNPQNLNNRTNLTPERPNAADQMHEYKTCKGYLLYSPVCAKTAGVVGFKKKTLRCTYSITRLDNEWVKDAKSTSPRKKKRGVGDDGEQQRAENARLGFLHCLTW